MSPVSIDSLIGCLRVRYPGQSSQLQLQLTQSRHPSGSLSSALALAEAVLATPAPCEGVAAESVAILEAIFSATAGSALTAAATPALSLGSRNLWCQVMPVLPLPATGPSGVLYILERSCIAPRPGDFRWGFNRNTNPETIMPRKGYYSPPLRRDLVKRLYFAAKDLRVPMTVLNDRLMEESLSRICEAPAKIIPLLGDTNQDTATAAA